MKKAILPLLIAVLLLAACGTNEPSIPKEQDDESSRVLVSGECFSVEEIVKNDSVRYRYTVLNSDGSVLEKAFCAERPAVSQVSENLVGMRFTDDNHAWSRYFDTEKGKVSESFMNAFWSNGLLVAYNSYDESGHIMVVRDIFDDEGFRSETHVESDALMITVVAAELAEDGETLTVEYVSGNGSNPDAKIFSLPLPLTEPEE